MHGDMRLHLTGHVRCLIALLISLCADALLAANPYLPLWEHTPDGEPYVFDDPDNPGRKRVYVYGSHDNRQSLWCGRDLVLWSAPVEDLNKWRFDGVIFRSVADANGNPLDGKSLGDLLFAPDVALKTDASGKKTYFLVPNNMASKRKSMIAKSDRPDGPFRVCNWDAKDPTRTRGCLGQDPALFVDDDGRVYGYWGYWRSMAAELDSETMADVKPGTKVVEDMVSGGKQPGAFRFFEASSVRKVKGKYVFIYSRKTEDGEFGLYSSSYTLAYAYSDKPLGPWTYGGTIIDGRARENRQDGTVVVTASPWGNIHGSICEINGKWYVFYHRQCGRKGDGRQAMVAPVDVDVEERVGGRVRISEAEYTSEGFESDGLDAFEWHPAGIMSYFTGGPYMRPCYAEGYDNRDPYDEKINRGTVVNITAGSVVGYKYFDFRKTHGCKSLRLEVKLLPLGEKATVEVWAIRPSSDEGGIKLGEVLLSGNEGEKSVMKTVDVPSLAEIDGRKALFFVFHAARRGFSICEIEGFRFSAGNVAGSAGMEYPRPGQIHSESQIVKFERRIK